MVGLIARDQPEGVLQGGLDQQKPVAAATRRTWQVHDQRLPAHSSHTTPEQAVGCLPDRISAERLRDPRYGSLDHRLGGLGREVARRDTRSARREDESGGARELADRGRDLRTLVRHDPVLDVEMLGLLTSSGFIAGYIHMAA